MKGRRGRLGLVVVALCATVVIGAPPMPAGADDVVPVPGAGIVQGPAPTVSGSNPTTVHFSQLKLLGTLRAGGHNYVGPFAISDLEAQIYQGTPGCNTPGSDPLQCTPGVSALAPGQLSSSTTVATLYGDHTYDFVTGTCGGPGSMLSSTEFFLLCTVSIDAGPPGQIFLTGRLVIDSWALRGDYTANLPL